MINDIAYTVCNVSSTILLVSLIITIASFMLWIFTI